MMSPRREDLTMRAVSVAATVIVALLVGCSKPAEMRPQVSEMAGGRAFKASAASGEGLFANEALRAGGRGRVRLNLYVGVRQRLQR